MLITYLIYSHKNNKTQVPEHIPDLNEFESQKKKTKQKHIKKQCRKPTKDNPFMNILIPELNDKQTQGACNIDDPEIKKHIKNDFNNGLYRSISDVYDKQNSQRQYYTTPVTSSVNEQTDFAKWLYFTPDTCKEGNGNQCIANISSPFLANTPFKYKYH